MSTSPPSLSARGSASAVTNEWTGVGNYFMGKNTYCLAITPGLNEQQHAAIIGAVMSMDMLRTKEKNSD